MVASKSPRAKAFRGLKELIGAKRISGDDARHEVFHFGIDTSGALKLSGDDRVVALVTSAIIEQALEVALLTKFISLTSEEDRQLFSDDGAPLSTLDAKIRMAFALGVIGSSAKSDLVCIKNIRNAFAHSRLDVRFHTPEIETAVKLLTYPERFPMWVIPGVSIRDRFAETGFRYVLALIALTEADPALVSFGKEQLV